MKSAIKFFSVSVTILLFSGILQGSSIPELFESSYILESKGNYSEALNRVKGILLTEPRNYTATLRVSWLSYLNRNYSTSIEYYQKAVLLKPHAVEPLIGLTLPLMAIKNWKETEKIALQIISRDPNNYYANSRLAYSLYSQRRYGEAKSRYELVLRLYPSDLEMKLGMGWTYLAMGNKNRAKKFFNEVLLISKSNLNALSGLRASQ